MLTNYLNDKIMNYYIQGKKDKADKIKAAFERLGCNTTGWKFNVEGGFYYTNEGKIDMACSKFLINLIMTHPDYQELELPVEPKFEVGDWIANDGCLGTYLITDVNDGYYGCESPVGERVTFTFNHVHKDFHLWTIADAKGGDVICTPNSNLFIYKCKGIGVQIYDYCGLYHGKFEPDSSSPNGVYNSCDAYVPATKEERGLFFAKMREAGYTWNEKKKELRKIIEPQFKVGDDIKTCDTIDTIAEIDYVTCSYYCESGRTISFDNQDLWRLAPKSHYDISNFKAGMPVLVRETNLNAWQYVLFSHCYTGGDGLTRFNAGLVGFTQCIPFNKDTEHLLGTTGPCDERFVNW